MKNYIQPGETVPLTAPAGGVLSGDAVLIGGIFGVACANAAEGAEFECQTEGVFELPKVSAQAWTQGAPLYWDAGTKKITSVPGDNLRIGFAAKAAANPSATGVVLLAGASDTLAGSAPAAAIPDLGVNHIALATAGGNTYSDAAVNAAVNAALDAVTTKVDAILAVLRARNVIAD
jgi:predicted RecA/RadA family phage recombinase